MPDINTVVVTPTVSVVAVNSSVPGSYDSVARLGLGWQDVTDPVYGAVGDGVTDDTAAINAAITACNAAGGGIVYVPTGTYRCGSALSLLAGVSLRGVGPEKTTLVKAFNGTLLTISAAAHAEVHDLTLDGNYTTNTGKGIVLTGASTRPVIQNVWSINFSGAHLEFGADAGEFAWVDGYNTYPEASQTDYLAIQVGGPDTGAMFRRFTGVQCTLGYINLTGAADTQFACSGFRRIETDSATSIVSVGGCVWANLSAAMTLNATAFDVLGCRMSGDVTLSSSFSGSFIGNTQTAGTFTDSTTVGNALVYHHALATSFNRLAKNILLPVSANSTEVVLTDRTATTGDGDITQTYPSSAPTRIYSTTLTADRTVTLSTSGAQAGATFTILRTAGGLFKVDVGGLVNLWPNQGCVVRYTGAAWVLVGVFSLLNPGQNPGVGTDIGDNNATLTVGLSAPTQLMATTLTGNKTITLSTTNAINGSKFRLVRTGLGAFTVDFGGLKTLPSATAAWVEGEYTGSTWVLTGYGTL